MKLDCFGQHAQSTAVAHRLHLPPSSPGLAFCPRWFPVEHANPGTRDGGTRKSSKH